MGRFRLTRELFLVPLQGRESLLYAPLLGTLCETNADLLHLLSVLDSLEESTLGDTEKEILDFLVGKGMLKGPEPSISPEPERGEFCPSGVALFPTNQCTMECLYCYAREGRRLPKNMDMKTAAASVDYVLGLLQQRGRPCFPLELHGGGEPFVAGSFVQELVEFVERRCSDEGMTPYITAATNGILADVQLDWIVTHLSSLCISFDILPGVQDYHRPLLHGRPSYHLVDRTIRRLDSTGFPYAIRCTVTRFNEDLLPATIDHLAENYRCRQVYLEPAGFCHPGIGKLEWLVPDLSKFAASYRAIRPRCEEMGIRLEYSGAQADQVRSTFCHVGNDDFAVTPEGYLTKCWEVVDLEHPLAGTFVFGRVQADGRITVDHDKLAFLRSLRVENFGFCEDCFAKWHCAGSCLTKLGHTDFLGPRNEKVCSLNRDLIADRLVQLMSFNRGGGFRSQKG